MASLNSSRANISSRARGVVFTTICDWFFPQRFSIIYIVYYLKGISLFLKALIVFYTIGRHPLNQRKAFQRRMHCIEGSLNERFYKWCFYYISGVPIMKEDRVELCKRLMWMDLTQIERTCVLRVPSSPVPSKIVRGLPPPPPPDYHPRDPSTREGLTETIRGTGTHGWLWEIAWGTS